MPSWRGWPDAAAIPRVSFTAVPGTVRGGRPPWAIHVPPFLSPVASLVGHDTVTLPQAIGLLAAAGDLATGQAPGSTERAARLAAQIAQAAGHDAAACAQAHLTARLRWAGCGAAASGIARLLGDDIRARHAMLARVASAGQTARLDDLAPLARVESEVAGDVAAMLGMPAAIEAALRQLPGLADDPARMRAAPDLVHHVTLAGDLEVLARVHGIDVALAMIGRASGVRHPAALVAAALARARDWLATSGDGAPVASQDFLPVSAPLALVADAVELKLPFLAGHARRVALLALRAAQLAGLPEPQQRALVRAALLHGIGRAGVPNTVWERRGALRGHEREALRRAPYLTARAVGAVAGLEDDAQLAAQAQERLDGSGHYRGLQGDALGMPQRLLAVAAAFVALRSPRPWRAAHAPSAARALLASQAAGGRLDRAALDAVMAAAHAMPAMPAGPAWLSPRESEVLRRLSLGESEREAGRALRISAGAVRTHADAILGKLGCASRQAATLRALALGLI